MSRTRDMIQEIVEIRQRRQFGSAMTELPNRLFELERAFRDVDPSNKELLRYFPVALVACTEAYFRMAIKDLIDIGDPYLTNAEQPAASIKLDFSLLKAVHGKAITVGELVAHGVSISRLEQLEKVMSSLLGHSFLQELRTTSSRWPHEVGGAPVTPVLTDPDKIYKSVSKTFELRHIICHEIASALEIEYEEIASSVESCVSFLRAADELVSETMYPGAPLTQTDMNIAAGESLRASQADLAQALQTLTERLEPSEIEALKDSQNKWQLYCDAWSDFVAGERVGGGTIWPLMYGGAAESTVRDRLNQIKSFRKLGDPA